MHKCRFLFHCLVQKQPSITIHYLLKNCCFKDIIAFMSYKSVGYGVDILNFIMLWFPVDDARDPAIKWVWCNVGVLDYDEETKCYFVQKVNNKNRIIDEQGKPVVDGYIVDGKVLP